ncbi:MAG: hypothetical protein Q4D21_05405 [Phascolarctobacterium sp.]|nr:hypothetical protein [Phascolarctobacterium sp.]
MKCNFCGHEVAPGTTECPYCHYQFKIDTQVLNPDERDDFEGITIEEDGSATGSASEREDGAAREIYEDRSEYESYRAQQRPEVKVRTFGCGSGILMSLLIMAIICSLFFFVLPTVLIFAAIGAVVIYVVKLLF